MKGQAFIIFKSIENATNAMNTLNGSILFGKQIRINFSKQQSDTIGKLLGKLTLKQKQKKEVERRKKKEKKYLELKDKIIKEKEINNQMASVNKILIIENLTEEINEKVLENLFNQYPGYKEVRLIPNKGIAFVDYIDESKASAALVGLNGMKLTNECILNISFAKN
jgi:RNA recognition motif-containing protein